MLEQCCKSCQLLRAPLLSSVVCLMLLPAEGRLLHLARLGFGQQALKQALFTSVSHSSPRVLPSIAPAFSEYPIKSLCEERQLLVFSQDNGWKMCFKTLPGSLLSVGPSLFSLLSSVWKKTFTNSMLTKIHRFTGHNMVLESPRKPRVITLFSAHKASSFSVSPY